MARDAAGHHFKEYLVQALLKQFVSTAPGTTPIDWLSTPTASCTSCSQPPAQRLSPLRLADAVNNGPSTSYSGFHLSLDPFLRQAARGRGAIVSAAHCNDQLVLATSRGYLLRYHFDEYGNEKVQETEMFKAADGKSQAVFVDPTGSHALICVKTPQGK